MSATTRQLLRVLAIGLATLLLAVTGHYSVVVLKARHDTPRIVEAIEASGALVLSLDDFPDGWIDDLLAIEDPAFHAHHGVDLRTPGAGLTTLTQALTKILYFEHFEPGLAKIRQTLIARYALDPLVSKKDQLTMFVNLVYLGHHDEDGAVGFAEASEAFFGVPFAELTRDRYLRLVAMIIAPNTFHVLEHPEANDRRLARIQAVLDGSYAPDGLMDLYYGTLTEAEQDGIAPASYFGPTEEGNGEAPKAVGHVTEGR